MIADRLGRVHFTNGMVRLDFVTFQSNGVGIPPTPKGTVRVILSPNRLRQALKPFGLMIGRLTEFGLLGAQTPGKPKTGTKRRSTRK